MRDSGRVRALTAALATAAIAFSLCLVAPRVDACGGFFSRMALEGKRRPSLAYEQTLIVFDAERGREHFVREVVFRTADEAFGFVVPTPSRPEVAAVKSSPFAGLRSSYPFEAQKGGLRLGGAGGGVAGSGRSSVQVLEVKKVGSFTAFVLAADDAKALGAWLTKNGLSSTPQADGWLTHYVKLKFFYVAMRYDPPAAGPDGAAAPPRTAAETMRISFDTPLPYYPYFEPEPASDETAREARLLDVWLVSRDRYVPVAALRTDGGVRWVRPLAPGWRYQGDQRETLARALGAEAKILPAPGTGAAELGVQRFTDQKRWRIGFGDIVFVPARKEPLDAAARARLGPLLATLDHRLLGAAP
jgi:hypothetical protein